VLPVGSIARRFLASACALLALVLLPASAAVAEPGGVQWSTDAEVGGYYDSDNVAVLTPAIRAGAREPGAGWSANGSYLVDIVSAASVDIVSAASPRWTELRHAAALDAGYKPGALGGSLFGATSIEPDYVSFAGGAAGSYELLRKHVTLALRYGFSRDVAGRTGTPFSVYALRLDRHTLAGSAEIVMGRATTLTPAFDLMLESGRQEKPYRWLPLFEESVAPSVPVGASIDQVNELRLPGRTAERVPDTRKRFAASVRLAHRFERSTLVLWDRGYVDDWGLLASTTELRWVRELSRRWSVWPRARFHTQSGVSFWRRAYVGEVTDGQIVLPRYRTGDRELGPIWSAALGTGVAWAISPRVPAATRITLEVQAIYTDFLDTLYIDHRWAGFGVASFSTSF
jgi:hypothetical protein